MKSVTILVHDEETASLRHLRNVLGTLIAAGVEIDGQGLPRMRLLADTLDGILSKIDWAEINRAQRPFMVAR